MSTSVAYARLERPSTRSFLTYQLPAGIHDDQVKDWVKEYMPDWEVIQTTQENPEKKD
jgi:predicted ATP-dependent Lon-type protease